MKLILTFPCLLLCFLLIPLAGRSQGGGFDFSVTVTYPVPSQSCCSAVLNFFLEPNGGPYAIRVYDQTGMLFYSQDQVNNDLFFIDGFCGGIYKCVVTNPNGLSVEQLVTVPFSSSLVVTPIVTNVSCFGGNNGAITTNVSGGSPPYSYAWSTGSTTPTILGLKAGTYTLTIFDNTGCSSTVSATLTEPCPLEVYIAPSNNTSNYALVANASGGTPGYTYIWSNGASGSTNAVQAAGTYIVTVTDNNDCTKTTSFTQTDFTANYFGISMTPIDCATGLGAISASDLNVLLVPGSMTISGPGVVDSYSSPIGTGGFLSATVNQPGNYLICGINVDSIQVCQNVYVPTSGSLVVLPIVSSNPAFCNNSNPPGSGGGTANTCEKVCPNTTFTYSIGNFVSCTAPPTGFNWEITGAASYTISPDEREVVITWGSSGSGFISVTGDSSSGCFTGTSCITIVDEPVAAYSTSPQSTNGTMSVCKGQTVQFNNLSIGADIYEWTFGDDLSNTFEVNPEHTFNAPGTHTVTLIARSLCLCADTVTLTVTVIDALIPIVDCVNSVCPSEQVTYTSQTGCGSYAWSVSPNGIIINGGGMQDDSITVQWQSGVVGTIGLTATACTGSTCPAEATLTIPILSDAAEIEGRDRVCPKEEANYSIQEFDGAGYTWTISNGGTIIEGQGRPTITVQWSTSTQQQWVAVEYDNCYLGCTGRDTLLVLIRPPFGIDGAIEGCAGAPQSFVANQIPGNNNVASNWQLFGPNGSVVTTGSNTPTFNHTFATNLPGNYRLLAKPAGAGLAQTCSDSTEKRFEVKALPPKPLSVTGPLEFCAGNTLTYQANGTSGLYNVQWTINKGNSNIVSEVGNPVNVTFGGTAPHWVAARQISTDGLSCTSDTVRLNVVPVQPFSITGPTDICEATLHTYTAPNRPGVDYSWQISPATAGVFKKGENSPTPEVFWVEPGVHTLVANACGQVAVYQVTVLANPKPDITAPAGICPNSLGTVTCNDLYNIYQWKNALGNSFGGNNISADMPPGSYALVVTDADGCKGTTEFKIDAWPEPNLKITTSDPTGFCNNSQYVKIDALLDEDFEYTYEWFRDGNLMPAESGPYLVTNQYGLYTCRVTNQYGCSATDGSINVFEYCVNGGVCHNPSHPATCPPGTVGMAITATPYCDSFDFKFLPSPGYLPGTLVWQFGESGGSFLGSATAEDTGFKFPNGGHYIVVAYAELANGAVCKLLDSVKVLAVANFSVNPACPGAPTEFIDESTFLPDVAAITQWKWDFNDFAQANIDTSIVRSPTWSYPNNGLYNVKLTVRDVSGCISERVQQIKIPTRPVVNFLPQAPDCAGNATPMAVFNSNIITNIHWKFGDPASGPLDSIDGFSVVHKYAAAGNYSATATATSIEGCKSSATLPVPIVPNTLTGNITPLAPTFCEGGSTTLAAPAGPAGSTYTWSTGVSGQNLVVTQEGTYSVTITSPDGCTHVPAERSVEVLPVPDGQIEALLYDDLDQLVGTQETSLELCFGENTHLKVIDNGSYNYNWSNGSNDEEILFTEDRGNLLTAGTYTYSVTITGSNGCTLVPPSFQVLVHDVPSGFTATANQNCAGTPAIITYNGPQPAGWQYVWNSGDLGTSFTTEAPGHYFVRVINQFGCKAESNRVTITPGPNVGSIPGGCHTRCTPDTLCITPIPGIVNWQWFFGGAPIAGANSPQFVATQSGTYYAVLTDNLGCVAQSDDLNLTLFTGFGSINGRVWSDVNDNGIIDAADTLVSGIPVQIWQNGGVVSSQSSFNNGGFSFQNILSTSYIVSVDSASLDPHWEIVIGADPTDLVGCDDVEAAALLLHFEECAPTNINLSFSVCPGESYTYNGVAIAAGSSQAFTVSNALTGCDTITNVNVVALPVAMSSFSPKICPGDTYAYQGATLAVGQTQQFTLTNPATGCDSLVTVSVSALPVATSSISPKICPGDTYAYQGANLAVGQTQQFTLTNPVTGCDSLVTVTVSAYNIASTNRVERICQDEQYSYQGTVMFPGQTQTFTLTNPTTGCDSLVNLTVQGIVVPITNLEVDICPGKTYNYLGQELVADSLYEFVLQTVPDNCDSIVRIAVNAFPELQFDIASTASCHNTPTGAADLVVTSGAQPVQWNWGNGPSSNLSLVELDAGTYIVTLTDANACTYVENVSINQYLPLSVDIPAVAAISCEEKEVRLSPLVAGELGGLQYLWSNGATVRDVVLSMPGTYVLRTTNICETVEKTVDVNWAESPDGRDFAYVPNVFAPDDVETNNAQFRAFLSPSIEVLSFKMEVFDRWGNLMFRALNPEDAWNAEARQKMADVAVYIWYLKVDFEYCGQRATLMKKGDVTVAR
jgi:PKD repeat protein